MGIHLEGRGQQVFESGVYTPANCLGNTIFEVLFVLVSHCMQNQIHSFRHFCSSRYSGISFCPIRSRLCSGSRLGVARRTHTVGIQKNIYDVSVARVASGSNGTDYSDNALGEGVD